jgi:hypothetical protein
MLIAGLTMPKKVFMKLALGLMFGSRTAAVLYGWLLAVYPLILNVTEKAQ